MLSDFGVLIAIVVVVGVDAALNIDTPKLTVPDKFSVSFTQTYFLASTLKFDNRPTMN